MNSDSRTIEPTLEHHPFPSFSEENQQVGEDGFAGESRQRSESCRRRRGAMRKSAKAGGGRCRELSDRLVTLQRRLHQALILGFRFSFFDFSLFSAVGFLDLLAIRCWLELDWLVFEEFFASVWLVRFRYPSLWSA